MAPNSTCPHPFPITLYYTEWREDMVRIGFNLKSSDFRRVILTFKHAYTWRTRKYW
jgi:hypothetical protein